MGRIGPAYCTVEVQDKSACVVRNSAGGNSGAGYTQPLEPKPPGHFRGYARPALRALVWPKSPRRLRPLSALAASGPERPSGRELLMTKERRREARDEPPTPSSGRRAFRRHRVPRPRGREAPGAVGKECSGWKGARLPNTAQRGGARLPRPLLRGDGRDSQKTRGGEGRVSPKTRSDWRAPPSLSGPAYFALADRVRSEARVAGEDLAARVAGLSCRRSLL